MGIRLYWFLAGIFALPAVATSRFAERHRKNAFLRRLFNIDKLALSERLEICVMLVCACLLFGSASWLLGTALLTPVFQVFLFN